MGAESVLYIEEVGPPGKEIQVATSKPRAAPFTVWSTTPFLAATFSRSCLTTSKSGSHIVGKWVQLASIAFRRHFHPMQNDTAGIA